MSEVTSLLLFALPVSLLAAISPIVFLNASTVATNYGPPGARRFLGGNAVVLAAIGAVAMGLLGEGVTAFVEDETAGRVVDLVLGALLVGYGLVLLRSYVRSRAPATSEADQLAHARRHGLFAWGMLGMATNYTTLPLYVAVGQRVGASSIGLVWKLLLLTVVTAIVLAPAWLPLVFTHLAPRRARISERTRGRIAAGTKIASIIACFVGGTVLIARAFL